MEMKGEENAAKHLRPIRFMGLLVGFVEGCWCGNGMLCFIA